MSKTYIAQTLKRLREQTKRTADEVGSIIGKSGKTVNAWENGRGQPDAEMLIKLSTIYKVNNLLQEFDETNTLTKNDNFMGGETLSDDEHHVVNLLRTLNDNGIKAIIKYAEYTAADIDYKK